jgi:hypothetical protein
VLADDSGVEVSAVELQKAGQLAIESVRTVPGLRWAMVDIVLLDGRRSQPLVEGMGTEPVLAGTDRVIAGNLDRVLETILGRDLITHSVESAWVWQRVWTAMPSSRR